MSARYFGPRVGRLLIALNLALLLFYPPYRVLSSDCDPIGASIAMSCVSIMFLKLVSYHHVNDWCRTASFSRRSRNAKRVHQMRLNSMTASLVDERFKSEASDDERSTQRRSIVEYPDNLTLKDLYYFICAPTLCYELNFPRSDRIRVRFLVKRALEMIFLAQIILACIQQWIIPTVQNSLEPFEQMNYWKLLDQLLTLAVSVTYIIIICTKSMPKS